MEAEKEPPKCQKRGSLATTTQALTLFLLSVLYVVKAVRIRQSEVALALLWPLKADGDDGRMEEK